MVRVMKRSLIGRAWEALGAVGDMARHVLWYVTYQVDGTARTDASTQKLRQRD